MKKKLAVFYLLLILSQIGNAQRFGVEGGLNISKPSGLISSSTSLVGIHFGPIIEFSLFEKSFIKSGFLYSEKGYKINFSDILNNPDPDPVFENPGTIKFRTGYIEIPVMMALLSWVLPLKVNRIVNVCVAAIMIVYQLGSFMVGSGTTLHYAFFSAIEILGNAAVIELALRRKRG
jgi:hypothetical protein